jgi:hypothetical protein
MDVTDREYRYAVLKVEGAEADRLRSNIVIALLTEIAARLKNELDPAAWLNGGWPELEAFTEALRSGGVHPALLAWQQTKDAAGRPAPLQREIYARRLAVLLCVALERAGLNKRAARRFAARQLEDAGVFAKPPTHRAIEHWQQSEPTLTPDRELLVATGFATAGGDPRRLAMYFIGLANLALNPTAIAVREESSREGAGYIGNFEQR